MIAAELGVERPRRRLRVTEWGFVPLPREVTGKGHWEETLLGEHEGKLPMSRGTLKCKVRETHTGGL